MQFGCFALIRKILSIRVSMMRFEQNLYDNDVHYCLENTKSEFHSSMYNVGL